MKTIAFISTFIFLLFTPILKAQNPPNGFNYSALARNTAGQPIATATIGIQISILKTSPTGATQYRETHVVNTDAFGLFNLVIGAGAVQSGTMTNIDWSSDSYFLKVDMDANGGTNFLTMGTTQLLSVPYALYAKSAGSISGAGGSFTHYIGEQFGGGVIFHVWKDPSGVEHGLIVDKTDLSTGEVWSNMFNDSIGLAAQNNWDGLGNSNAIIGQVGHTNSAAALCLNANSGGFNDWYLPSIQEFNILWNNYFIVRRSLMQMAGATQLQPDRYWSSTEFNDGIAWYFGFGTGSGPLNDFSKGWPFRVRAIRAF